MLRHVTLFILCLTSWFAQAADDSVSQLQALLTKTNSLSAHFEQIVTARNSLSSNLRYLGDLKIQRPGKFRWQVREPEAQTIVADGKNLWIYDQELEQVSVQAQKEQIGEAPALLLTGDVSVIAEKYQVEQLSKSKSEQWFVLKPTGEGDMIKEIRLGFANETIQAMQIYDAMNGVTELNFTKVQINPELAASDFQFTPPDNVDVFGKPL